MIERLENEVIALARQLGVRIAVAESLTGGGLAATLINVPGASQVVSGGVVAYNTALKERLLGVNSQLLLREGPVHYEVARQMARGVREVCATPRAGDLDGVAIPAEIGVSTTGVAGPDPDPFSGQPAGTVWVGFSRGATDRAQAMSFAGTREEIRSATVQAALELLRVNLSQVDAGSGFVQE